MSFKRLKKRTRQKHKKIDKVTYDEIKDADMEIEEENYNVENKKDKIIKELKESLLEVRKINRK